MHIPEKRMVKTLREHGGATMCFRPSLDFSAEVIDEVGNLWSIRPINSASPERGSGVESDQLLATIRDFCPDFVIIKGLGTRLESALAQEDLGIVIKSGGASQPSLLLADLVISESSLQERYLRRRLGPPSVRLPKQVHETFRRSLRAEPDMQFDVINVGRFIGVKNHKLLQPLVEANLEIALVGDGPLEVSLRARWQHRANVHFLGRQSVSEVKDTMSRSRVLVHVGHPEGLPRVVVEALAAGLPVVGLRGALDPELVTHDVGRLVRPEGLLAAVQEVLAIEDVGAISRACIAKHEMLHGERAFRESVDRLALWFCVTNDSAKHARYRWRRDRRVVRLLATLIAAANRFTGLYRWLVNP